MTAPQEPTDQLDDETAFRLALIQWISEIARQIERLNGTLHDIAVRAEHIESEMRRRR